MKGLEMKADGAVHGFGSMTAAVITCIISKLHLYITSPLPSVRRFSPAARYVCSAAACLSSSGDRAATILANLEELPPAPTRPAGGAQALNLMPPLPPRHLSPGARDSGEGGAPNPTSFVGLSGC